MTAVLAGFSLWVVAEARYQLGFRNTKIRALALRGALKNALHVALRGHAKKHVLCRIVRHQPRRKPW